MTLTTISFSHPFTGKRVDITHDEPSGFLSYLARERRFFEEKKAVLEELYGTNGTTFGDLLYHRFTFVEVGIDYDRITPVPYQVGFVNFHGRKYHT